MRRKDRAKPAPQAICEANGRSIFCINQHALVWNEAAAEIENTAEGG